MDYQFRYDLASVVLQPPRQPFLSRLLKF